MNNNIRSTSKTAHYNCQIGKLLGGGWIKLSMFQTSSNGGKFGFFNLRKNNKYVTENQLYLPISDCMSTIQLSLHESSVT